MKIKYNSPVILTYTIISISVMFLAGFLGNRFVYSLFSTPVHAEYYNLFFYFKLISYIAGHANWGHLIGNFIMILLVGPLLEEKYSSSKLLEMIFITAIVTSLVNLLLFPSSIMGGSGISFMLILLASFSNIKAGEIPLTFIIIAVLFLGNEVAASLESDQISQFSHIVGGLVGAGYGFLRIGKNYRRI